MDTSFEASVGVEDSDVEGTPPVTGGFSQIVLQWMAVAAAWVTFRPYLGIIHDARLYFHYARFADAEAFSELDLIVSNDRQMSRTVYAWLARLLIDGIGFATAAMVAAVTGVLAWIAAISSLGRSLFGRDWWILVVFAPAFPAHWGPLFSLAEPFAAPRALSAALGIGAISLAISSRFVASVPLLFAATLIHPLVALPGIGVVVVLACIRWRRIMVGTVVAAVAVLIVAVVDPLSISGTAGYDAAWLDVISNHAHIVLPKEWIQETWVLVVFGFTVVAAAWARSTIDRVRSLSAAAAITGGVGLAISLVFAMVWVNPMIVQLQPWRALWAVHLAALVGFVDFGLTAVRSRTRESVMAFVAIVGLTVAAGVQVPAAWFAAQVALSVPFLLPHDPERSDAWRRWRIDAVLVAMVVGLALSQIASAVVQLVAVDDLGRVPWVLYTASFPGATLGVAALISGLVVGHRFVRNRTMAKAAIVLSFCALLAMVAVGVTVWDQRTEWQVYTEELEEPIFDLPVESLVLSEDGSIAAVTLTQRPTFVTNYGAAGVAFSRDLATDVAVRSEIARGIGMPWAVDFDSGMASYGEWVRPTAAELRTACSDPKGPTHLLVFREAVDLPGIVWKSPVPIMVLDEQSQDVHRDALVLYTCVDILP